jgi:hypothetical protein
MPAIVMVSYQHIINFSPSENIYFTDQLLASNRKCSSINSQLLMSEMSSTSANCPAVGGINRLR